MIANTPEYVAIIGPTASGKSRLAMSLAKKTGGEIIACDSVQVFRGFDIGSSKPTKKEQAEVRHHLLDVVGPKETFDAGAYALWAKEAILAVASKQKLPIVVGGTGLYLRALWGYGFHDLPRDVALRQELELLTNEELYARLSAKDQMRAKQVHLNDRYRVLRSLEVALLTQKTFAENAQESANLFAPSKVIFCNPAKELLAQRIADRVDEMMAQGWVEEVKRLLAEGCSLADKPMMAIGYREICATLTGNLAMSQLRERIILSTRQYAKRQMTWFSKMKADIEIY